MRKFQVVLLIVACIAAFASILLYSGSFTRLTAHASSPPGACWQDRCDLTKPSVEKCGTPFRAQNDVAVDDPVTQVQLGSLRMWKTGASGSGCMDIWATFAGNGNESGQYTLSVVINKYENSQTGDNDGLFASGSYTGGNGNHDTGNLGYEGHNEDGFQADVLITASGQQNIWYDTLVWQP